MLIEVQNSKAESDPPPFCHKHTHTHGLHDMRGLTSAVPRRMQVLSSTESSQL